jgi:hypothetical protein
MSEPIGMIFQIGGVIPRKLIEELLAAVQDEVSEITGPTTVKEFLAEVKKHGIKWYGTSDYGECDGLKLFCRENKIAYTHECDGKYEYNAGSSYWFPRMKEEQSFVCTQDGDEVIDIKTVRPICMKLLAMARGQGNTVRALATIERKINKIMPVTPDMPKVVITE